MRDQLRAVKFYIILALYILWACVEFIFIEIKNVILPQKNTYKPCEFDKKYLKHVSQGFIIAPYECKTKKLITLNEFNKIIKHKTRKTIKVKRGKK